MKNQSILLGALTVLFLTKPVFADDDSSSYTSYGWKQPAETDKEQAKRETKEQEKSDSPKSDSDSQ